MLIAVDPGLVTGIITIPDETQLTLSNHQELEWRAAAAYLQEEVEAWLKITLIWENYHITANKPEVSQKPPLYICGILEHFCYTYSCKRVIQEEGDRQVITREMLEKLEMYYPSKDKHMVDAAKHMLIYLLRSKLIKMEELM